MKVIDTKWFNSWRDRYTINGKSVIKATKDGSHVEGFDQAKEVLELIDGIDEFEKRLDTRFLNWVADRLESISRTILMWATNIRFLNTDMSRELKTPDPVLDDYKRMMSVLDERDNVWGSRGTYLEMKTADYIKKENEAL